MLEQGIGLRTEFLRDCAIEMEMAEVRRPVREKRGRSERKFFFPDHLPMKRSCCITVDP
jgi:hypothetical protein